MAAGDAAAVAGDQGVRDMGVSWRPESAWLIQSRADHRITEVIAENVDPTRPLCDEFRVLLERDIPIIPHGIGLSLGGAEPPDSSRLSHLARVAELVSAPFVSEHIAFVRAGPLEAGHLLPVRRSEESLEVLIDNLRHAQQLLPVPLVVENVATLFEWPQQELSEGEFLRRLLDATGCHLLLDLSNLYANSRNLGWSLRETLDALPLERVAYAHLAGGQCAADGLYHDTHRHPIEDHHLDLAEELRRRAPIPILLERDGGFESREDFDEELDDLSAAMTRGDGRRKGRTERRLPLATEGPHAKAPESRDAARRAVAQEQTQLLAALLGEASAPPGFDEHALEVTAQVLRRKRGELCDHGPQA